MSRHVFHEIVTRREHPGLHYLRAESLIRHAIRATLAAEGVKVPCCVNVLLTDDEGIHQINREFREVDRATDVLSFPQNECVPGAFDATRMERDPQSGCILLGDMVLSLERAAAQGEEFGHGIEREIGYLTVHSILHLLGYDHMDEGPMKRQMRAREEAICDRLGLGCEG
ncbi:MAG: rRNA maturation RNase YbeY [Oscillospiraceae bacterium]|jgi:probable rRNA maturation factor